MVGEGDKMQNATKWTNPYKRTAELNLFKSIGLILNLCKSPYGSYNVHKMDDNEANMCSDAT